MCAGSDSSLHTYYILFVVIYLRLIQSYEMRRIGKCPFLGINFLLVRVITEILSTASTRKCAVYFDKMLVAKRISIFNST